MKTCLEKNAIAMYSTHNEGKSVIAVSIWRQYQKMCILIN